MPAPLRRMAAARLAAVVRCAGGVDEGRSIARPCQPADGSSQTGAAGAAAEATAAGAIGASRVIRTAVARTISLLILCPLRWGCTVLLLRLLEWWCALLPIDGRAHPGVWSAAVD